MRRAQQRTPRLPPASTPEQLFSGGLLQPRPPSAKMLGVPALTESCEMKVVTVKNGPTRVEHHYVGDESGPYYEVYEDAATEWVFFVDAAGNRQETLLAPFETPAAPVRELILRDMRRRGYPVPDDVP